jgi:hypothetical protein
MPPQPHTPHATVQRKLRNTQRKTKNKNKKNKPKNKQTPSIQPTLKFHTIQQTTTAPTTLPVGKNIQEYYPNHSYNQDKSAEEESVTTAQSMEYSSSEEQSTDDNKSYGVTLHKDEAHKIRKGLSKAWKEIFDKRISTNTASYLSNEKSEEKPSGIQSRITTQLDKREYNIPFGNDISSQNEYECFLFHNINGIKDNHNWLQINMTMKDLIVTCFGFAEINTSMRGNQFKKWNDITRKTFIHSRTTSSESDLKTETNYKPGGTISTIVEKWQARVTEHGSDPSGLGRWSYMIMSSNKKKIAIITAYKPCKTTGPNTTWSQQWILLREKSENPEPIATFCKDLNETLMNWRSKNMARTNRRKEWPL